MTPGENNPRARITAPELEGTGCTYAYLGALLGVPLSFPSIVTRIKHPAGTN